MSGKKYYLKCINENERLDVFLAKNIKEASRSYIKILIKENNVSINSDVVLDPSYKLKNNDQIIFNYTKKSKHLIKVDNYKLDIKYEDENKRRC